MLHVTIHANPIVTKHSDTVFISGKNSFYKTQQGLWELYVEGDPLERGLVTGSIIGFLLRNRQDQIFFSRIEDIVPSKFQQKFASRIFSEMVQSKIIQMFRRNIKTKFMAFRNIRRQNFNDIAPQYQTQFISARRSRYWSCSAGLSFGWLLFICSLGRKSEDGNLILGRNFDFYAGDELCQRQNSRFYKPERRTSVYDGHLARNDWCLFPE